MLSKAKSLILKTKILFVLPVALSIVALTGNTAFAALGPITYNHNIVAFFVPTTSKDKWQLSIWHKGVLEDRVTGTAGQDLKVKFPKGIRCHFQVDVKNLAWGRIVYSGHINRNHCKCSQPMPNTKTSNITNTDSSPAATTDSSPAATTDSSPAATTDSSPAANTDSQPTTPVTTTDTTAATDPSTSDN